MYLNLFEPPEAGLQLEMITKMSTDFRIELAKLPHLVDSIKLLILEEFF